MYIELYIHNALRKLFLSFIYINYAVLIQLLANETQISIIHHLLSPSVVNFDSNHCPILISHRDCAGLVESLCSKDRKTENDELERS